MSVESLYVHNVTDIMLGFYSMDKLPKMNPPPYLRKNWFVIKKTLLLLVKVKMSRSNQFLEKFVSNQVKQVLNYKSIYVYAKGCFEKKCIQRTVNERKMYQKKLAADIFFYQEKSVESFHNVAP